MVYNLILITSVAIVFIITVSENIDLYCYIYSTVAKAVLTISANIDLYRSG